MEQHVLPTCTKAPLVCFKNPCERYSNVTPVLLTCLFSPLAVKGWRALSSCATAEGISPDSALHSVVLAPVLYRAVAVGEPGAQGAPAPSPCVSWGPCRCQTLSCILWDRWDGLLFRAGCATIGSRGLSWVVLPCCDSFGFTSGPGNDDTRAVYVVCHVDRYSIMEWLMWRF